MKMIGSIGVFLRSLPDFRHPEKECARTERIFCEAGADYVIANMKELTDLIRRVESGDEEKISA